MLRDSLVIEHAGFGGSWIVRVLGVGGAWIVEILGVGGDRREMGSGA